MNERDRPDSDFKRYLAHAERDDRLLQTGFSRSGKAEPTGPKGIVSRMARDGRSRRWNPLDSQELTRLLSGFGVPWWVGGGVALDLFMGRRSRAHYDVDVWMLRRDGPRLRAYLSGWDLRVGLPGTSDHSGFPEFSPGLESDPTVYGVWATPESGDWDRLEFLLQDTAGECWQSRYGGNATLPIRDIGVEVAGGIPVVRPELVLLTKTLAQSRRRYLAKLVRQVAPEHRWLSRLGS